MASKKPATKASAPKKAAAPKKTATKKAPRITIPKAPAKEVKAEPAPAPAPAKVASPKKKAAPKKAAAKKVILTDSLYYSLSSRALTAYFSNTVSGEEGDCQEG